MDVQQNNRKANGISVFENNNQLKNTNSINSNAIIIISDDEDCNRNLNDNKNVLNLSVSGLNAQKNSTLSIGNTYLLRKRDESGIPKEKSSTDNNGTALKQINNTYKSKSLSLVKKNTARKLSSLKLKRSFKSNSPMKEDLSNNSSVSNTQSSHSNLSELKNKTKRRALFSRKKLQRCLAIDDSFERALTILETERPPFSMEKKINSWITDCIDLPITETETLWNDIYGLQQTCPGNVENKKGVMSKPKIVRETDNGVSRTSSPTNYWMNHDLEMDINLNHSINIKSRLIESRIDYENVDLSEKRNIFFKTPTPPRNYLLNRVAQSKKGCQYDFLKALGLLNKPPTKYSVLTNNQKLIDKSNCVESISDSNKTISFDSINSKTEVNLLKNPEIQIVFHLSSSDESFNTLTEVPSPKIMNGTILMNKKLEQETARSDYNKIQNCYLPDNAQNNPPEENRLKLLKHFESNSRYAVLGHLSNLSIYKRKQSKEYATAIQSKKIQIVEKLEYNKSIENIYSEVVKKNQNCLVIKEDFKSIEKNVNVLPNFPMVSASNYTKKFKKTAKIKRPRCKNLPRRKVNIICSALKERNLRNRKVIQIISRRPKGLKKAKPGNSFNSESSIKLCNSTKLASVHTSVEFTKPLQVRSIIDNKLQLKDLGLPGKSMTNPLNIDKGEVLYGFYENETLIIIQTLAVSFWKYSKIVKIVGNDAEWALMDECIRKSEDSEIQIPYKNRICMHDSTPIYTEIRAKQLLSDDERECNLSSIYINLYYFHKDKDVAIYHSIQLDTVKCSPKNIIYTTISDSRYFIMCWKQEVSLGKIRTGLCKYSMTPDLKTLASIREFKLIQHLINYLESIKDDKLVGFGESELTIWDHRTGDIILNIDLGVPIGINVGSFYCLSDDAEINNILIICQMFKICIGHNVYRPEVKILAISVSQQPSYRYIYNHELPDSFQKMKSFINTGEYIILTSANNDEVWISCNEPNRLIHLHLPISKRFYSNENSKIIKVTDSSLVVDTLLNQVLQSLK